MFIDKFRYTSKNNSQVLVSMPNGQFTTYVDGEIVEKLPAEMTEEFDKEMEQNGLGARAEMVGEYRKRELNYAYVSISKTENEFSAIVTNGYQEVNETVVIKNIDDYNALIERLERGGRRVSCWAENVNILNGIPTFRDLALAAFHANGGSWVGTALETCFQGDGMR